MWSSTNQRIKALMSARQREKDRLTRPIFVRRTDLVLSFRSDDDVAVEVPARALLNDFTAEGFYAYAATRLNPNVEITLKIEHPKPFVLTAKVVWCQYQASSAKVVSGSQNYAYRIALALLWKNSAQESEFRKFCAELSDLYVSKKGLFIEEAFPAVESPRIESPSPARAPDADQVAADLAADRVLAGETAPETASAEIASTTSAPADSEELKQAA